MKSPNYYTIPLCLTHKCNLNCIYCFEKHDSTHEMSYETAVKCIDYVCDIVEKDSTIEILFFGGEPLLCFDLIQRIFEYVVNLNVSQKCRFFASTNGVLLTTEMKLWFKERSDVFVLGLSLDGTPRSHNINRSNSYDKIDIDFFRETWPAQNIKMTVSEHSLENYAGDVLFLHSLGFGINGGDICLGDSTWQNKNVLELFCKQLLRLIDYYADEENALYNALINNIDIAQCAVPKKKNKQCGIGDKVMFFDTDGRRYPCTFITPMTFSQDILKQLENVNFKDPEEFIDSSCFANCYLYPICKRCPAENLLQNKSFQIWGKERCGFTEVLALVISEIEARKIIKNPSIYDNTRLYYTIEAIKTIRDLYQEKYSHIIKFE